ncbi:hypothetical protein CL638_02415 [bacterium]|nr:hypothetical protein [bacterium]
MKGFAIIAIVTLLFIGIFLFFENSTRVVTPDNPSVEIPTATTSDMADQESPAVPNSNYEPKPDLIVVENLNPGETITSPVTITGKARGYWFFEATFPIIITRYDGEMIAQGYATAEGDWMTEDFVPFTATVEYVSPYSAGGMEFEQKGSIILEKQNASGLPENADSLVFPITFAAQ